MSSRIRQLILAMGLASLIGCTIEAKNSSPYFPVTGKVTYQGVPIKLGAINFLAADERGTSATGEIVEGEIVNVTSKSKGDGMKVGAYRVTIVAFPKAFVDQKAKRNHEGPNPKDIRDLVLTYKDLKLSPARYSNIGTSGLTADITNGPNTLSYDLKDD